MNNLNKWISIFDRLFSRLKWLMAIFAAGVTFVLIMVITINVSLRYSGFPFPGVVELSKLLMSIIVFFPFAYVQARGANIKVDILFNKFSLLWQKIANIVILLFSLGFWVLLAWFSGKVALEAYIIKEYSMGLIRFPTWIMLILVAFSCIILCMQLLTELIALLLGSRSDSRDTEEIEEIL